MLFDLNKYSPTVFRREAGKLIGLAWPMMMSQIAGVGVGVVDTVMAGRAGTQDLTAVALGSAVFATVYITLMGVMAALNPLIAQLHGAGKRAEVGEMGRQGLWFGLTVGLAGMVFMLLLIAPMTAYLDMEARVETMLAQYLAFTAFGMPAAVVYQALHAYAASLNRPKPMMWISWARLLLNIPLNYVFVYGAFGMPALGGAGCGLATALVFWFGPIVLAWHIFRQLYFQPFGLFARRSLPEKAVQKQIWQLGWPIAFSYFLEASLFTMIVWLIARFGETVVSAQQVVLSITSVVYMVPQSLGAAATVRIGYAVGMRRFEQARYISGVAVAVGWLAACCTILILLLFRQPLSAAYTDDAAVAALAAGLLLYAAVFQFFDFTQCITSYALRGYKLTRMPMVIHAVSFWGLGLLPGCLLAYSFGMGIHGFWLALILSLAVAAVALTGYLQKCSRWSAQHRSL